MIGSLLNGQLAAAIASFLILVISQPKFGGAISCFDDNQYAGNMRKDCAACMTMLIEDARGNKMIPRCSMSSDCFECKTWTKLCQQSYTQCTCKCCGENECNKDAIKHAAELSNRMQTKSMALIDGATPSHPGNRSLLIAAASSAFVFISFFLKFN